MKVKVITLIIIVLFSLLLFKAFRATSQSQQEQIAELQNAPDKDTISWHARLARAKGQRKVLIPGPINDYAIGVKGLDDALSHYGAVVAQQISQKSYIASTNELYKDNEIRTWYKFKILENLSQKPLPKCSTCGVELYTEKRIPQELLPLNADEILIETDGGTIEIDGVTVIMLDRQIPNFSESKRYLLLLSVDPSGKVGLLNMGPVGIYTINSEDMIEPISKQNHPVVRDIIKLHGNHLETLRDYIQRHPSTQ